MTKLLIEHKSCRSDSELISWMETELPKIISEKARTEEIKTVADRENKTVIFSGRMVKGCVRIDCGIIKMEIEVPLLYRPFIPAIRTVISNVLKEL